MSHAHQTWDFVDEFEIDDESYSFHLCKILFDGDRYRIAFDSGCSCPCPWEDTTDADFEPYTAAEAVNRVREVQVAYSCIDDKRLTCQAIQAHAEANGVK